MIFLPYIGTGLFVFGVVALCFWMDHQRTCKLAFHQGWEACEKSAAGALRRAAKEGRK